MLNQEELLKIIERIAQGTASEEDLRRYNTWCNLQQNGDAETAAPDFSDTQKELFRRVNGKIDQRRRHRIGRRLTAAAAVLLLFSLPLIYKKVHFKVTYRQDLAIVATEQGPASGGTQPTGRATLVLTNGTEVALSSASNGKLPNNLDQLISKVTDSSVVYKNQGLVNANRSGKNLFNKLVTAPGQQYRVTLPDGTTVRLNSGTALKFPVNFYNHGERRVELVGEAFFDVVHDGAPFIIQSNKITTTVLGTAFNIKAYPATKHVTVSVVRGKVKVENKQNARTILIPNQQVTYNTEAPTLPQTKLVDATAYVASWLRPDMVFEDLAFQKVAALLGQRFGVTLQFKNKALAACTIKASFNGTDSLDKIMTALCLISNASYTRQEGNIVLIDGEGCGK
ncbi:MAG: FecR domain-containing protein [Niabella sp.]|nr:FecR domain-containing protein [Niabella sp.]